MAKGNFIDYVVSNNPNKYPNDGEQGSYYYTKFPEICTFTYKGSEHEFEKGMTWKEFVNSEYNIDHIFNVMENNFVIYGNYGLNAKGDSVILSKNIYTYDSSIAVPT